MACEAVNSKTMAAGQSLEQSDDDAIKDANIYSMLSTTALFRRMCTDIKILAMFRRMLTDIKTLTMSLGSKMTLIKCTIDL